MPGIIPPKIWLHPLNNLEILLIIEKLNKIYKKKLVILPNFWAKIGLFLIRILRKVVRCNGIVVFNHSCKRLIINPICTGRGGKFAPFWFF